MIVLYDYWRSSAAYRLRIALNLMNLPYEQKPVDLLAGEHKQPGHMARHPQGLVPALEIDGGVQTQSLAILEYLDETREAGLLPEDAQGRARVRALSYVIAMDIHPVCNLSVAAHAETASDGKITRAAWMARFIRPGLEAFERMLDDPETGQFCHQNQISLADICLMPQLYNADRWGVDVGDLAQINRIREGLADHPAFVAAHPDNNAPDPQT